MASRPALRTPLVGLLLRWLSRRRFPTLLVFTALFFALDVLLPDGVPLADELLLGLATVLLAAWRRERGEKGEAEREAEREAGG